MEMGTRTSRRSVGGRLRPGTSEGIRCRRCRIALSGNTFTRSGVARMKSYGNGVQIVVEQISVGIQSHLCARVPEHPLQCQHVHVG